MTRQRIQFIFPRVGAAFVPLLDSLVHDNSSRIDHIICSSQPQAGIIVASSDTSERVKQMSSKGLHRLILLEEDGSLVVTQSMADDVQDSLPPLPHWKDPSSPPLYVLYTSGSTGMPKGVIGTHGGLINRIVWQMDTFPWDLDELVCRRTPLTFVDSLAEMLAPLLCGIPLWVPPFKQIEEEGIHSIVELAAEAGVSRITLIPSQLQQLLRLTPDLKTWTSLRYVTISGEKASMQLVRSFLSECPNVTLLNIYGSTEVAGDVTFAVLNDYVNTHDHVNAPIGHPIINNTVYLLQIREDEQLELLQEEGVAGQLAVSGAHVCRGYLNDIENTSMKFRPNPFLSDSTLFLTGDIATYNESSGYTWTGRLDNQVKVRGVRVGLEEVESIATQVLNNMRVVVVDIPISDSDDKVLIMVIEVAPEDSLSSEEYLKSLSVVLPKVSMPSAVVPFKIFPKTSSGKIDRKWICEHLKSLFTDMDFHTTSLKGITASDVVNRLKYYISSVLPSARLDELRNESSFFGLGGDSMRAIELLWKLRNEFHVPLSIKDLNLSIQELADEIAAREMKSENDSFDEGHSSNDQEGRRNGFLKRKSNGSQPMKEVRKFPLKQSKSCSVGRLTTSCGCMMEDVLLEERNIDLKALWKQKLKKCIDTTVVFVSHDFGGIKEELLIVGSHGGDLCCFFAETGELKWTCDIGEHIEGSAIVDHKGRVYIGAYAANDIDRDMPEANDDNKGGLYAIELSGGEISWMSRVKGEIKCTPAIHSLDGVQYVWIGSYDGFLYSFNSEDGSMVHSVDCGGAIFSSPCYSEETNTLYCATIHGHVFAVQVCSARILWEINLNSPIYSSIAYVSNMIIFGSVDASLYALDADNGHLKWSFKATRPIFSSPVVILTRDGRGVLFGCHDGNLRYVSVGGNLVWSVCLNSVVFATPFIYKNIIAASTTAGKIFLINQKDGSIFSSVSLPAEVFSTPIIVNQRLYCGCRDDYIYSFKLDYA